MSITYTYEGIFIRGTGHCPGMSVISIHVGHVHNGAVGEGGKGKEEGEGEESPRKRVDEIQRERGKCEEGNERQNK